MPKYRIEMLMYKDDELQEKGGTEPCNSPEEATAELITACAFAFSETVTGLIATVKKVCAA